MFCSNCGSQMSNDSAFCPNCGTKVTPSAIPQTTDTPNEVEPSNTAQQPPIAPPAAQAPYAAPSPSSPVGKLSRNQLISIVAGAAVIVIIAIIWLTGGKDQSSPEAAVKSFIEATDDADAEAMLELFHPDSMPGGDATRKLAAAALQAQLEESEMDVTDYEILDVEEDGDYASVTYRIEYEQFGEKDEEEDTLELVKEDGKWYLDENLGF
ncbi:zinc-ribbon domain-containing protein [Marinicrinis lubricantis]|uniref:Zinc-ribbon domain-containing protein n=1 Tax=Marinicrinis lubricantis TaxID=2086470 RepID=A0ABW1IJU0_9BACL